MSTSRNILFHKLEKAEAQFSLSPHNAEVNDARLNLNCHVVATAGADGLLKVSHIEKGQELLSLVEPGSVS